MRTVLNDKPAYKRKPLSYRSTVTPQPILQSTDTWQTTQPTKTPQTTQSIESPESSSLSNTQNQLS